jgi:hypothetical protein
LRVTKPNIPIKMEERQLTKLADWFKSQRISCLKILAKALAELPDWVPIKTTGLSVCR